MESYNWQQSDWPDFTYSLSGLENELFTFAERIGRISGAWEVLPEDTRQEAVINMMVAEAIKTSEIEGEYISRKEVLSSIRNNLGLHNKTERIKDRRAKGVADLMIDVHKTYQEPLTEEKLFAWHKTLLSATDNLKIEAWRTHKEPMQVVSGAIGKEKVHYEAPPSSHVPQEMNQFISWFNKTAPGGHKKIQTGSGSIRHCSFIF